MTQNGLLIHANANPMIGTARLMRSLVLAKQWRDDGGKVVVVSSTLPGLLLRKIAMIGCEIVHANGPANSIEYAERVFSIAGEHDCQWVAIDDSDQILIQNLARRKTATQKILVIGNVEGKIAEAKEIDFVSGTEPVFTVFRRDLAQIPVVSSRRKRAKRCLVDLSSVANDDSAQFIKRACSRLAKSDVLIDFVTPFARVAAEKVRQQKPELLEQISWHRNIDRPLGTLATFDLAVMSDMASACETAFAGIATLCLIHHQETGASSLPKVTETPWVIDAQGSNWIDPACQSIANLINNSSLLQKHAKEMSRIVDDHGAIRLCHVLRERLPNSGAKSRSA